MGPGAGCVLAGGASCGVDDLLLSSKLTPSPLSPMAGLPAGALCCGGGLGSSVVAQTGFLGGPPGKFSKA